MAHFFEDFEISIVKLEKEREEVLNKKYNLCFDDNSLHYLNILKAEYPFIDSQILCVKKSNHLIFITSSKFNLEGLSRKKLNIEKILNEKIEIEIIENYENPTFTQNKEIIEKLKNRIVNIDNEIKQLNQQKERQKDLKERYVRENIRRNEAEKKFKSSGFKDLQDVFSEKTLQVLNQNFFKNNKKQHVNIYSLEKDKIDIGQKLKLIRAIKAEIYIKYAGEMKTIDCVADFNSYKLKKEIFNSFCIEVLNLDKINPEKWLLQKIEEILYICYQKKIKIIFNLNMTPNKLIAELNKKIKFKKYKYGEKQDCFKLIKNINKFLEANVYNFTIHSKNYIKENYDYRTKFRNFGNCLINQFVENIYKNFHNYIKNFEFKKCSFAEKKIVINNFIKNFLKKNYLYNSYKYFKLFFAKLININSSNQVYMRC